MKLAYGHLRYTPDVFWGMSLREWQAALKGYLEKEYGGEEREEPLTSDRLDALMRRYPDDRPID
jgi:uncharacterized phage protein (TIGR02216 family)